MPDIITAGVRAAMERLKEFCHGEMDSTAGDEYRLSGQMFSDTCEVNDAMLSLFPGDMPEPWTITRTPRDVETPVTYTGLFIPLQRTGHDTK